MGQITQESGEKLSCFNFSRPKAGFEVRECSDMPTTVVRVEVSIQRHLQKSLKETQMRV